ncbi:beta strand repeat-containing protein [Algicola sagamiensis]|uniref:beta strand repeat-containing protein n=1 Tax=Algicola sagamiensis TaxID=163869 RepID=UPI00038293B9|nr:Ig-like domain-containing protein [Algicola sagamiensis]
MKILSELCKTKLSFILLLCLGFCATPAFSRTELSFQGVITTTAGDGTNVGSIGTKARWQKVGTLDGVDFDVEIEVIENTHPNSNSLGFFTGSDDAIVRLEAVGQVVKLHFNFYKHDINNPASTDPITVIPAALIGDIDGTNTDSIESVRVLKNHVADYILESSPATNISAVEQVNGSGDTEIKFTSDFDSASGNDTNVAIYIAFQPTSSVEVIYQNGAIFLGRNYTFDGNADSQTFFTSPSSNAVDTTPPTIPTVNAVTSGGNQKPTITGTAEAFTTLDVTVAGATYRVVTPQSGNWSIDTSTTPVSGTFSLTHIGSVQQHNIVVVSKDAAQNQSTDTTTDELTYDLQAPTMSIQSTTIATSNNQTSYPITGSCETSEGNVTVTITGLTPGGTKTVACNSGNWTATFDVSPLADGNTAIQASASQTDSFNNTGTTNKTFVKDAALPNVSITNNGSGGDNNYNSQELNSVALSGTTDAEDGQFVSLSLTDSAGNTVSTTAAVSSGTWTANALDLSSFSDGTLTITANVSDAVGNNAPTVTQTPAIVTSVPSLTANQIGVTNDQTPAFSGTTGLAAGTVIIIKDGNGTTVCTATAVAAAPSNTWSCSPTANIASGTYSYTANVTSPEGNTGQVNIPFQIVLDSDNDGIPDFLEGNGDTDGDGLANTLDTDSDNDGIPDKNEFGSILLGTDADADGIDDGIDVDATGGIDANGNNIDDSREPLDSDGDGTPNFLDTDSDNDGIPDHIEGTGDPDGDGLANYIDIDSDNDRLVDAIEAATVPTLSGIDTDNDGIDDAIDINQTAGNDTNNNGIDDAFEPLDTDNDGTANYLDRDSDNDKVPDALESRLSGTDTDNDGLDDSFDVTNTNGVDADGDGVDDAFTPDDFDNDGQPNYLDTDSDNDGLSDQVELNLTGSSLDDDDLDGIINALDGDGNDTNKDGIADNASLSDQDADGAANQFDIESDGDGIPDASEGAGDIDGDGIPNFQDTDSDNDGISDTNEIGITLSGSDTDNDGIDNAIDVDNTGGVDANGNNIDDSLEPIDTDGDGTPNYLDSDSDNDGIPDILEGNGDSDNDGLSDQIDIDSDNDGLVDAIEASNLPNLSGNDADNDGIDDAIDIDQTSGNDTNNNGIDDALEPLDTDGDGIANHLDRDSDNDSVPDALESRLSGNDADNDGLDDSFDVSNTNGADADSNGIDDAFIPNDFDRDGIPNYLDIDSDNDGLSDTIELNLSTLDLADDDNDGIINALDGNGNDANLDGIADTASLNDQDLDGRPNQFDLDSDNDSQMDVVEAGLPDADNNGTIDSNVSVTTPPDGDNDAQPDYLDLDSNDDGTFDIEGNPQAQPFDTDSDGKVDATLNDTDEDGVPDAIDPLPQAFGVSVLDATTDTDQDSVIDVIDLDDDNDGITDTLEGSADTDNDGLPNQIDLDSDGDGIPDSIESNSTNDNDLDSNGVIDNFTDTNGDGLNDSISTTSEPVDTDADGTPDFLDVDSDNDGFTDFEETNNATTLSDNNDDGVIDNSIDQNQNGLTDQVDPDATPAGEPFTLQDSDNDGKADFVDNSSAPSDDGVGIGEPEPPTGDSTDSDGGKIQTAVSGHGRFHLLFTILLTAILWSRRRKSKQR